MSETTLRLFSLSRNRHDASWLGRASTIGAALALTLGVTSASAQGTSSESDEPAQYQPEIQTQAVDALDKLGKYLHTLRSFRVDADSVTDAVLSTGQNVGFLHHTELQVQRPDKVRAVVTGGPAEKGLVYDGHSFVLFNDAHSYYSKVPAPPTIRQLIADADTKYGVRLPLIDLFYWGDQADDDKSLTTAIYIGLDKVDGKWCNHYAYQQPGLDWELWMQSGSRPLPCRFVITDTTQSSRPQHAVNYHWTLNPQFDSATFIFRPGPNAKRIPLRPEDAPSDQKAEAQ
jgi:hypothetical protein